MKLSILPGTFAVCRLLPHEDVPHWAFEQRAFLAITYTVDELSIVCLEAQVPKTVHREGRWRAIKVQGPLAFELTGILANLTAPLATEGIALFAVSTFDTDYLLVKQASLTRAKEALERHGHVFIDWL